MMEQSEQTSTIDRAEPQLLRKLGNKFVLAPLIIFYKSLNIS